MNRLIDVAVVLSGIAPPKRTGEAVSYVQIKDLRDPLGSLMRAPAPAPSARRATPIDSSDILVPSRGEELGRFSTDRFDDRRICGAGRLFDQT